MYIFKHTSQGKLGQFGERVLLPTVQLQALHSLHRTFRWSLAACFLQDMQIAIMTGSQAPLKMV
jgi:hypothetical protein